MAEKSWHLKRRTFIKGVGVTLALPFLEAMGKDTKKDGIVKRSCVLFTGNGVGNPQKGQSGYAEGWYWFPKKTGKDFEFSKSIEPYKPLKDKLTILGGLWNKNSEKSHPHSCADIWLTGGQAGGKYENALSIDQAYAIEVEKHTRYSSLTLSCDEGTGSIGKLTTMSHNIYGTPIPAFANPRKIFETFFVMPDSKRRTEIRKRLSNKQKYVDRVLGHANLLKKSLGKNDQNKMEEFLSSINDIEVKIKRQDAWLDTPLKEFNSEKLNLNADNTGSPEDYYQSMFDLIVLAFQLDLTRSITFTMNAEQGSIGNNFPLLSPELKKEGVVNQHEITHNKTDQKFIMWGKYDRWNSKQVAYFLDKLSKTQDQNGSILDSSIVLSGNACSGTHNIRNNPLVLAGGSKLGLKHGRYMQLKEGPICNLYVTMLNQLGVETEAFGDSDGELTEILS